ncbi:MAG: oligosaccharide flippase family protein [Candidatus Rokubacteria bacterium]|nr:oligosaccharide flippase family protein [Candidatus Rokubacteria bacterium]
MSPLGRRLVRGSAVTFASSLLTRALAAVQSIVIARLLDPHQVGVFAIVIYVLGLAAALADFGLPTATARLVADAQGERRREVRGVLATLGLATLATATVAGFVLFAGAGFFAGVYDEPALAVLFRLAAVLLVLSLTGGFVAGALQGLQRIELLAAVSVFKGVATVLGIVVLLPAVGLAGILVASLVAETLALLVVARPIAGAARGGAATPAWTLARRSVHVATPVFLNGLLLWGTALVVRSWLAGTRGYADVGYFQLADALSRIVLMVAAAITVPLVPMVAEVAVREPARVATLGRAALRATLLGALPPAIFLSVGAPAIVVLIYGSAYADAGVPTALLAPSALLQGLAFVAWSIFVGSGRGWAGFAVQAVGHAALIALGAALIPGFGAVGLGIAQLVAGALSAAIGVWSLHRTGALSLDGSGRLLALAVAAWMAAALAALGGVTGLAPAATLALVVAGLAWWTLRPEETAWVRRALRA